MDRINSFMLSLVAGIISSSIVSTLFFYFSFFGPKKIRLPLIYSIVWSILLFFVVFASFFIAYIIRKLKITKLAYELENILTKEIFCLDFKGIESGQAFSLAQKLFEEADKSIDVLIMSGSNFSKSFLGTIQKVPKSVSIRICLMHPRVKFKWVKMFCEAYGARKEEKEENNWIKSGFERTRIVFFHGKETINTYKNQCPHSKISIHYIKDFSAFQGFLIDKKHLIVSSHFLKPEIPGYQQKWLYFDKSKELNSEQRFIFNIFNNFFELEYFNGVKAL